jgi:hypothetical protein
MKPKGIKMVFPVDSYLTAERALAQIVTDATAHHTDVARGIETLTAAHTKLDAMLKTWTPAGEWLEETAIANPDDPGWQALKIRKDRIIKDYMAMVVRAQAVRDAATAAS